MLPVISRRSRLMAALGTDYMLTSSAFAQGLVGLCMALDMTCSGCAASSLSRPHWLKRCLRSQGRTCGAAFTPPHPPAPAASTPA
jgi:hypothetical protein